MKKINIRRFLLVSLLVLTVSVLVSAVIIPSIAFAVKPKKNLAGALKVDWNLSAAVMPVPPYGTYGSRDIPGSDTASKLIVNQPNGNTEVTITGAMNGLNPNTEYTVYLSKAYKPYVFTGWNIVGDWVLRLHYGIKIYDHDVVISDQSGVILTGTGGYPAGGGPSYSSPYNETITGEIDIMLGQVMIHSDYENSYWYEATGTIASDGTMSGTWHGSGQPTYTWESIDGKATKTHTGSTGWPGLFTSTVQPFTFTTDEYGAGGWHLNLRDEDFPKLGTYSLSVWINEAGKTILISDVFEVTVD